MPLLYEAEDLIRENLIRVSIGERPPLVVIGCFTEAQFAQINASRLALELHELETNEIIFMGRHLYTSRAKDFYTIDDMVLQIQHATNHGCEVILNKMQSCTRSIIDRDDGYGNLVKDLAVYEMTARKPRAELFSVMPKGDANKPPKA